MFHENEVRPVPGLLMLALLFVAGCLAVALFVKGVSAQAPVMAAGGAILGGLIAFAFTGFFAVAPNEARVLTLFGNYRGTVRRTGLWFANPFMSKKRVSVRIRNFETSKLKVNDANSNPVEIGAIVVWRVIDTAEALFEVNDYVEYVAVQSESALRALASTHPYDSHSSGAVSLSTHQTEVNKGLVEALHERLAKAGVEVIEARISHLAYAPEIAAAMLQRQQAGAIVAARTTIVEGAVGMVELALEALKSREIVELDGERKAAMVSNLLVVLCSDRAAQPVLNTGSLYT